MPSLGIIPEDYRVIRRTSVDTADSVENRQSAAAFHRHSEENDNSSYTRGEYEEHGSNTGRDGAPAARLRSRLEPLSNRNRGRGHRDRSHPDCGRGIGRMVQPLAGPEGHDPGFGG